jgi:hypothetical protein
MTDYEKISDFQNLYKAHLNARKGKRKKTEVVRFELNLAQNLAVMSAQLVRKSYKMHGYYHFTVTEPKQREIFAAYYPDRVLLHCICDEILTPLLQKRVIYDNCACQLGKGTHFAMNRLNKFMREHYREHGAQGYFLKCDVRKYFASIDHAVLKERLAKILADKDVQEILFHFIDSYETEGRSGAGLPLGNQSSQWFAIYYLDPLDRLIKEVLKVKHYVRYMDDCLLIHHDKAFLQNALAQMRELVVGTLKLELNEKTQIFPLRNGVEFVGWYYYLTETGKVIRKLKQQSKLRFKRRLGKLQKDYAAGTVTLEDVKNSLASYHGHLKHGHTYKLKAHVYDSFILKRDWNIVESSDP